MNRLYLTKKEPLNVENILYLESDSNYTRIFTQDKKIHSAAKTLHLLHKELDPRQFLRINRSVVMNTRYLSEYSRKADTLLFSLSSGQRFKASRRRIKSILEKMAPVKS